MDLASGPAQNIVSGYLNINQNHFPARPYNNPSPAFPSSCSSSPVASSILNAPAAKERPTLPKVGQTRCYWTLLTSSLQFTVLDPVLSYHLQDQASSFLDRGLLDFVHPDERESARRDLGNVLAERTLHGSVTRVRYCRLSRVRRLLGWSDSSLPYPPSFPADLIAVDADYMAVYLVVNCVADGVVLCFIHAVVDIAPQADNDEMHKTGWSNWCSTYGFDQEIYKQQAHALYQRLCEIAMPIPRDLGDLSLRVLQIFRNQPDRSLVLSWPPDSALLQDGFMSVADSLAQLAQHVQLGYSASRGGNNDARTSCTRRYKSVQTVKLPTVGGMNVVQVESILIPHGTIIFACHKVNGAYLDTVHSYSSFTGLQNPQSQQTSGIEFREIGDVKNRNHPNSMLAPSQQDLASQNYVRQWVDRQSQVLAQQDNYAWDDPRSIQHPDSSNSTTRTYSEFNFASAADVPSQNHWNNVSQAVDRRLPVSTDMADSAGPSTVVAVVKSRSETLEAFRPSTSSSTTRALREVNRTSRSPPRVAETPPHSSKDRPERERFSTNGRVQGNPPVGVLNCAHCQITHSPEWRKGPSGKKDLCNACGLRYSRSRAKKEGIISRKRKNKKEEGPPLSKQHSLSKNSRLQPDSTPLITVHDAISAENHKGTTRYKSSQDVNETNAVTTPQSLGHPGSGPSTDAFSTAFSFAETSHSVQIPYFS